MRAGGGMRRIPVNLLTGFLGSGKTTVALGWLDQRPEQEYWAVVVNEFGEVGFDGALLGSSGAQVREIPGGCICCTNGVSFIQAVSELLALRKPDRVLVEPSGLAHPALIVDALRSRTLRERVELHAVVGLVRPDQLSDFRVRQDPVWRDQLEVADILVLTHGDEVEPAQEQAFNTLVSGCFPRKLASAIATKGDLSLSYLSVRIEEQGSGALDPTRDGPLWEKPAARVLGWAYSPLVCFDFQLLERAIQEFLTPTADGEETVGGLRGVFRTQRGWLEFVGRPGQMSWQPLAYRRDSQVWWTGEPRGEEAVARLRGALDELASTRTRPA
jgi:hypothetical protein